MRFQAFSILWDPLDIQIEYVNVEPAVRSIGTDVIRSCILQGMKGAQSDDPNPQIIR